MNEYECWLSAACWLVLAVPAGTSRRTASDTVNRTSLLISLKSAAVGSACTRVLGIA
jgi:hypothetical protein